jgi:gliding motility-associated-like protein
LYRKLRLLAFLLLTAVLNGYGQVPVADALVTPLSGCAPLAVSFSDVSTNAPTSYFWNFGGGLPNVSPGSTTAKNTAAVYNLPGTYTVTHTATNASGTSTNTYTTTITVFAVPTADFNVNKNNGCYPTTIQFTNTSSPDVTSWIWDFGDGYLDNTTYSPGHNYRNAGSYPVTLAVQNANGCKGKAQVKNVAKAITLSNPGVIPDFITNINSSCTLPVNVNFLNQTNGPSVLSYSWDFGDGLGWSNILASPSNNYTAAGNYTVKLAASSTAGCTDTLTTVITISSSGSVSDFTGAGNVCLNTTANFKNISSPSPTNSDWDYGDGTTDPNKRDGQHVYTLPGTYTVTLNNTFAGCTGTVSKTVTVAGPPVTAFTGTNLNACKPSLTTQFTDQTTPAATSWLWDFGNGVTSTLQNPTNVYAGYGSYQVSLTASTSSGCATKVTKPGFVNVAKPIVTITNAPAYGCAPFSYTPTISVVAVDGVASYAWDMGNGFTFNGANPPPQIYAAGNYNISLTVTTNGGCQAPAATGIVKVGSIQPVTNFSALPTSTCVNTPIQFTDMSPGSNQWFWEFGDGSTDATGPTPLYSYPKPGVYDVTLTAYNNGCFQKLTKTAYITINPPLADFKYAFVCGNKTNYTFTDNSTGPITTWDWDFGDGTPHSFVQNPTHVYATAVPKSYNVTLKVTNGACPSTQTQQINVNQTTTINTPVNPICNNTTIPIFTAAPNYIVGYMFDFGDGSPPQGSGSGATSHAYTTPGVYFITVTTTDNNGCPETSAPYKMTVSGPTVKFTTGTQISCGPLPATFQDQSTPSAGSSLTKWDWDFGDGGVGTGANPTHNYTFQGIFPVKLKVTDNNGCSDSLNVPAYITVSIPVAKFVTSSTNYCPSSNIKFNNTSTGGFGSVFDWDFKDGTTFTGQNPPLHNYPAVNTYAVKLTMKDIYNCSSTYTAPLPINIDVPNANFTMSSNYSACPPLTVQFTFAGHYDSLYSWNFDNNGSAAIKNPSSIYSLPGDYYPKLIVTSPGGCTATFSDHIHIDGPVGAFTYSPLTACDSVDVTFNVTSPNSVSFIYNFNDGTTLNTNLATITHRYNVPGGYTPFVQFKDAGGCTVTYFGTSMIEVDAITKTSFTADKTVLCDNGSVTFKDNSIIGQGTTITNYDWNFGDGNTQSGMFPNPTHAYVSPGVYTVTMSITTLGGCFGSFPLTVTVAASPQVDITGIVPQCEPAILTFGGIELVPDPNGPLSWSWDFGNGKTDVGQNPAPVSYPKAGQYTVQLIATNTMGCKDTAGTVPPNYLFIYPIPSVNAGADTTICLGTPLQLIATGSLSTTFNWVNPTPPAMLSCTACYNPMANVPSSMYFVVNGTSPQGCAASDTIQVTVNVPVTVTVGGPDSVCLGQSTQLIASGAAIYDWTPAQGLDNPNIANPIAKPDASQIGAGNSTVINYQVTGYDSKKCFSDTKSVDITAFNYPVINLVPNATINVGSSYQISSTATTNIVSLDWTPSNSLSCANCLTPLATPTKTTKYLLTAINDGGCATTDSIRIQVVCNGANFFVPNSFSPNGDGVNDHFIVNGKGLNVIPSITIYNRWGQIVFQKSNFAPNSASSAWDGTFNGQPAPADVYVYTIQILCDNATLIPYHGNVTLIR